MRVLSRLAVFAVALAACGRASARRRAPEPAAAYFPPGAFAPTGEDAASLRRSSPARYGAIMANRYARNLAAMGESPLWPPAPPDPAGAAESYRLLVLRSLRDPAVVAVRVVRRGAAYGLVVTVLRREAGTTDGAGVVLPNPIARRDSFALDAAAWARLRAGVEAAGVWELRARPGLPGELDGDDWVLEAARGGRYHAADRWSPGATGPDSAVRALGRLLLELARAPEFDRD